VSESKRGSTNGLFITVDFADDETERAYQEHVREMFEELPEYCRNAEKVVETIKKVGGKTQNDQDSQTKRKIEIKKLVTTKRSLEVLF